MKNQILQFYTDFWAIHELQHILGLYYAVLDSDKRPKFPKRFYYYGSQIHWSKQEFRKLAKKAEIEFTREAFDELRGLLDNYKVRILETIWQTENTLEKAKAALISIISVDDYVGLEPAQIYDALVLLRDKIDAIILLKIENAWLKEYKQLLKSAWRRDYETAIFWLPITRLEDEDAVSHYRFYELFHIEGFSKTFQEVEEYLEAQLTDSRSPYLLWLIARSPKLTNKLEDAINIALRDIEKKANLLVHPVQTTDENGYPKLFTLTLYSLILSKLGGNDRMRELGKLTAQQIIQYQNKDGSWPPRPLNLGSYPEFQPKWTDYFPTVIALDALIRSGIESVEETIEKGVAWLKGQQNKFGLWGDELGEEGRLYYPFPFNTVLVLEVIELAASWKLNKLTAQPRQQQTIFISYSRKDWKEYVEPFLTQVQQSGFNYWLDQDLIQGGQDWLDEVNHALDKCPLMLLFLSPEAVNSKWVKMEYRRFIEEDKQIIPVMCRETKLPAELARLHWLPISEVRKIIARLNSLSR